MPYYATTTDVIRRFDIRRLSQFLSDTGNPVCTQTQINSGACATILLTNDNLLEAIQDASNKVLMACRVADRYKQEDLDSVYADESRRASLVRIVCDLTAGYIMQRRLLGMREVMNLAPGFRDALDTLSMLERGLRVFDDAPPPGTDAPAAGAIVENVAAPGANGGTCAMLWTQQVCPIFPQNNNGGPGSGGGCCGS